MMGAVHGRLFAEGDGWFRWVPDLEPGVTVRVQLTSTDGRQRIDRMEIAGDVSARVLRSIPIGRIEASANTTFGQDPAETSEVDAELIRPAPPAAVPDGFELDDAGEIHERPAADDDREPDLVLEGAAPRTRKPDDFYERVADLYRRLSVYSSRPAADIADANGVPVTTVHRWVKEARHRDLLPPGRVGAAG